MIESQSAAASTAARAVAANTSSGTSSKTDGHASTLTSDFETFLKMLTAQARYQDPLEPIDSTEYAAQLAQFSMVEQQVKTNDTLAALAGQNGGASISALAGWVGMEVRAVAPAYFDGSPVTVTPRPAAGADRMELVVHDKTGKEVQRLPIPISSDPVQWAGVDEAGQPFSVGLYTMTVESFRKDATIQSDPAQVYAKVIEAQIRDGSIDLILDGGRAIPSGSVTALRNSG